MTSLSCALFGIWCSISGPASAVDGDTLDISGTRIRLWGIDAPERNETGGQDAKRWLSYLVYNTTVNCVPTGIRSHGRTVAQCSVSQFSADLGESMVRAGFALDCFRYSHGRYRDLEPPAARQHLTQKPYC